MKNSMKTETQEIFTLYRKVKEIQNLLDVNQDYALSHKLPEYTKIDIKEIKRICEKYGCGVHWALDVFNGEINEIEIDDIQKSIGKTKVHFFTLKNIMDLGLTKEDIQKSAEYIDNISGLEYSRESIGQITQLRNIGITVDEVREILNGKRSHECFFILRDFLDCYDYLVKSKSEKPKKSIKPKL